MWKPASGMQCTAQSKDAGTSNNDNLSVKLKKAVAFAMQLN